MSPVPYPLFAVASIIELDGERGGSSAIRCPHTTPASYIPSGRGVFSESTSSQLVRSLLTTPSKRLSGLGLLGFIVTPTFILRPTLLPYQAANNAAPV